MTKVLLLTLASALVTAQQPEFIHQQLNEPSPIDPTVAFNYGYEVNDADTGDAKTHQEALENGVLRGSYSVVQPDGNKRIVEYEADEVSGFQARVRYESGYPIQAPSQPRPSAGAAVSSQGSRFASGSSSRGSRPNRPSQGARIPGSAQSSRFAGGASVQRPRLPIGSPSQGPRFGPAGPVLQGAPAKFIGGPPPKTSQFQGSKPSSSSFGQSSSSSFGQDSSSSSSSFGQSSSSRFAGSINQVRPTGPTGVSASQGSQFGPPRFPGAPSGSQFIGSSRPTTLPQVPVLSQPAGSRLTSSTKPQAGAQGSRISSGSSSQTASISSQSAFASRATQTGQSGNIFSGPPSSGALTQGISTGSRLQVGPPPAVPRPVAPAAPRPGSSAAFRPVAPASTQSLVPAVPQPADVAVHIAPSGFFSQRGSGSSSASASQTGAGGSAQAGVSGASFQQDSSSSSFHSGASSSAFPSNNAASTFQSGPGSRFAIKGGPAFDNLISSSLLVTNENLDSIDAVELASAGFDDSAYAYRLVPVPVNN